MPKRVNKTKQELTAELERKQKLDAQKKMAQAVFPAVAKLKTVYDAQTAFNAAAGFMLQKLSEKTAELKVSDLGIDLKDQKDSDIKKAIEKIIFIIQNDNAEDAAKLIEMMGAHLPQFLAAKAMKGKMSQVTAKEFLAD